MSAEWKWILLCLKKDINNNNNQEYQIMTHSPIFSDLANMFLLLLFLFRGAIDQTKLCSFDTTIKMV